MRDASFCFSRPPILASKINPRIMFFQDTFLDTLFDQSIFIFAKMIDLGDPFKIQWAPKWDPKSTKWRQKHSFVIFTRVPSLRPDFWMHFGNPLAHFWCHFGTLWLDCIRLWCRFCNIMLKICQDLQGICQEPAGQRLHPSTFLTHTRPWMPTSSQTASIQSGGRW